MLIDAASIVPLSGFPLSWRWTKESHASFNEDELASVRPIHPDTAATIWQRVAPVPVVPNRPQDRVLVVDASDPLEVSKWLGDRLSGKETEILLLWDERTAALVSRELFVNRWDDFWYPSSDDLTVLGTVGHWRIEMSHHGELNFFNGVASGST